MIRVSMISFLLQDRATRKAFFIFRPFFAIYVFFTGTMCPAIRVGSVLDEVSSKTIVSALY